VSPEKAISLVNDRFSLFLFRKVFMSQDEFVIVWNASNSLDEVAEKLGRSKASVSVQATILRKAGTDIKKFQRGRKAKPEEVTA